MNCEVRAKILNKYGFHARPSTSFAGLAQAFASQITVSALGVDADGKSIMGLMTLGAPQGTEITIRASGDDAEDAAKALKAHVDGRFGGIE